MGCAGSKRAQLPADGLPPSAVEQPAERRNGHVAKFETARAAEADLLAEMPLTASNFIDLAKGFTMASTSQSHSEFMNQFGCPFAKDPTKKAGTGGPDTDSTLNLGTGETVTLRRGQGLHKDELTVKISNEPARSRWRTPPQSAARSSSSTVHNDSSTGAPATLVTTPISTTSFALLARSVTTATPSPFSPDPSPPGSTRIRTIPSLERSVGHDVCTATPRCDDRRRAQRSHQDASITIVEGKDRSDLKLPGAKVVS